MANASIGEGSHQLKKCLGTTERLELIPKHISQLDIGLMVMGYIMGLFECGKVLKNLPPPCLKYGLGPILATVYQKKVKAFNSEAQTKAFV